MVRFIKCMNNNPTTPNRISQAILELCSEIDSSSKPVFVPVHPAPNIRSNFCMTDVQEHASRHGGKVQYGWTIWELPDVYLEAEFHTVWVSPADGLIDITPKLDNESQILFLPDSYRVYKDKLVDNKRKPLVDNQYTRMWLLVEKKKYEIMKKHFVNGEVDGPAAQAEFEKLIESMEIQKKKIGRNDPCYCGSGKKYKRCCGLD